MSDVIGVDPVKLEEFVDKAMVHFKSQCDAMPEEAKLNFRESLRAQFQASYMVAEEAYQNAIDHVLALFDIAAKTNSIPFIRDAIVRLKKV